MADEDNPVVLLDSGHTLKIRGVLLYEERRIREIEDLKAAAAAKFGPASASIGVIGSPAWVLGASAVMSLLENAASKRLQREGLQYLQQAEQKSQALVDGAAYCEAAGIINGHLPHPELWAFDSVESQQVNVGKMGWSARGSFLKQHKKTKSDIQDGFVTIEISRRYVHNGDAFVRLETDIGILNVRWSSVVGYAFPDRRQQPKKLLHQKSPERVAPASL